MGRAWRKWDARGERSDLESGETQPADALNLQRRWTNIKSERGSEEIDLKTFYLPVRDTEIAPSDAMLPLPQAISAATRDLPVKIKRSCPHLCPICICHSKT